MLADSKAFRLAKRQAEIELDIANNEAIVANSKKVRTKAVFFSVYMKVPANRTCAGGG